MCLIRVFQQERLIDRCLWFLASLIRNKGTLTKYLWFSCRYKSVWDIGMYWKPHFCKKKYIKWLWNPTTDFSLTSANKPQSSLVIYLQIWSQSWPYNSLHKIGDNSLNKKQKRWANFILNVIDSLTMPYTSLISTWDWFALFEIKTCRKIRELFFHRLFCYSPPVTSGSLREFFFFVGGIEISWKWTWLCDDV